MSSGEAAAVARALTVVRTPTDRLVGRFLRNRLAVASLAVLTAIHLAVFLAPWVAPYNPDALELGNRFRAPSAQYWLGTDEYGRDVLTRLLFGGRVSLAVGLASMIASMVLGVAVGALPILVLTGKGAQTQREGGLPPDTRVYADLADAVKSFIK